MATLAMRFYKTKKDMDTGIAEMKEAGWVVTNARFVRRTREYRVTFKRE